MFPNRNQNMFGLIFVIICIWLALIDKCYIIRDPKYIFVQQYVYLRIENRKIFLLFFGYTVL
jgi:hypothetical protein